jgi:hypothetical protein
MNLTPTNSNRCKEIVGSSFDLSDEHPVPELARDAFMVAMLSKREHLDLRGAGISVILRPSNEAG